MSLKGLTKFEKFDAPAFFEDKVINFVSATPLKKFDANVPAAEREVIGTKVELIITADATVYGTDKSGSPITGRNAFNKFNAKLVGKSVEDFATFKQGQEIEIDLTDAVASVYGDYRNELSLTVKDIKPKK